MAGAVPQENYVSRFVNPGYGGLYDGNRLNRFLDHPRIASEDGVFATPGGGQANARKLVAYLNNITQVATGGDSVKLPQAQPGIVMYVFNNGANSLQVFSNTNETINGAAGNVGVAVAAGRLAMFLAVQAPGQNSVRWLATLANQ